MAKVLSVYLPSWPVQLAIRDRLRMNAEPHRRNSSRLGESAVAVLLVAKEHGKQWVACACERAGAKGVRVGMSLAHAKALLNGMCVWERPFTPAEDAQRLHRLARWAQRFSPVVAADEPDGLLLDMAGCERLLGGDEQMVAKVHTAFTQIELHTRLVLAPTVGCAWALARFGDRRITIVDPNRIRDELAPLPIAGLRIDPIFVGALHEVGIERIGSLFDLPREELACRFGADLLRRLDQATGQTIETITPVRPSTPLEATRLYDGPVTSLEAIVMSVRELLFSVVLQLEELECGALTLDVELQRMAAEPFRLSITLTYPSRDVRHLWKLLHPKLERVNLGCGVESVSLRAMRTGKLLVAQLRLQDVGPEREDQGNEAVVGEFLDRLMDRMGRRAVCAMAVVESHVPEEAFALKVLSDVRKKASHPNMDRAKPGAACVDRPSHLFERPEPAQVISLVPEGPPSWMRWRGRAFAVHGATGPERIALPWWTKGRGEAPSPNVLRDYYEVQDNQGWLLWVFRDHASKGWFVHGLWA